MLGRLGDPDLLHQLDAGDPCVDRGYGRRALLEAARGRRRGVVVDVHLEDVLVGEPAGGRRPDPLRDLAPREQEAEPGRAEQVLDRATGEEVHAAVSQRPDLFLIRLANLVERDRPVRRIVDSGRE